MMLDELRDYVRESNLDRGEVIRLRRLGPMICGSCAYFCGKTPAETMENIHRYSVQGPRLPGWEGYAS